RVPDALQCGLQSEVARGRIQAHHHPHLLPSGLRARGRPGPAAILPGRTAAAGAGIGPTRRPGGDHPGHGLPRFSFTVASSGHRSMPRVEALDRFRLASPAGVFLDFDGTLAEIVARPELAQPRPEAVPVLARLVERYAVVAIISGRPPEEVRSRIEVPGVDVFGQYGLPEGERAE